MDKRPKIIGIRRPGGYVRVGLLASGVGVERPVLDVVPRGAHATPLAGPRQRRCRVQVPRGRSPRSQRPARACSRPGYRVGGERPDRRRLRQVLAQRRDQARQPGGVGRHPQHVRRHHRRHRRVARARHCRIPSTACRTTEAQNWSNSSGASVAPGTTGPSARSGRPAGPAAGGRGPRRAACTGPARRRRSPAGRGGTAARTGR